VGGEGPAAKGENGQSILARSRRKAAGSVVVEERCSGNAAGFCHGRKVEVQALAGETQAPTFLLPLMLTYYRVIPDQLCLNRYGRQAAECFLSFEARGHSVTDCCKVCPCDKLR
jgi:hypothetical protein